MAGGQAGGDDFRADHGGSWVLEIGFQVVDEEGVDVAAQRHGIAHRRFAQVGDEAVARRAVAIPLVRHHALGRLKARHHRLLGKQGPGAGLRDQVR